jgi:enoyl-CoA hydratase/carnithine racemase
MAQTQYVSVAREDGIVTVTLDSGRKLNALNMATWEQLNRTIDRLAADDEARCIVLRGAGPDAFAAGADIAEFETVRADSANAKSYGDLVTETVLAVAACRHPTIALVQGVCVGGGLEIAGACDLRICGESSRFGIPINRLGLVMGYPELRLLIDLVGRSTALEILFEGRILDAGEAREKGLVNRVVPDSDVVDETYRAARRIAGGAPLVARWHKKFAQRLMDPAPLTRDELDEAYACYDTDDYRVGRQAFLGRKKPEFGGH